MEVVAAVARVGGVAAGVLRKAKPVFAGVMAGSRVQKRFGEVSEAGQITAAV